MSSLQRFHELTRRPVLTEKGSDDMSSRNAYHFRVPLDANKVEIRQAVQKVFSVRVQSVNTIKVGGKARRRGWVAGRRPDWKKALVTLHPDDSLDVY
jgi:large subunit ribosomal protein L23